MPRAGAGQSGDQQERHRRQAGQQRQHAGRGRGDHQRVWVRAKLHGQPAVHLSLGAAFGNDDAGGGGNQQRRYLRDQAVADGQGGEGAECTLDRHVRPQQSHRQAAEDVDQRDDQGADGVAADELAGAVHRAVEAAFLG